MNTKPKTLRERQLEKKQSKAPDLLVYQLTSAQSECGEYGAEMCKGELLFLEKGELRRVLVPH